MLTKTYLNISITINFIFYFDKKVQQFKHNLWEKGPNSLFFSRNSQNYLCS